MDKSESLLHMHENLRDFQCPWDKLDHGLMEDVTLVLRWDRDMIPRAFRVLP